MASRVCKKERLMSSYWRIELLGGLRLAKPGRNVTRFQTYKNGALLAYLAYHRNQPATREHLIHLFWENSDMEAARNSLRVALNSLRKQLEPPDVSPGTILEATRTHVQLNPLAIETDVDEFARAMDVAQKSPDSPESLEALLKAADLYQGDLLPGWYEDWITPERSRLAELHISALQGLVQQFTKTQNFGRAIDCSLRLIAADPLRESAYRNLMRLYAATSRPANAVQVYGQLENALRENLNVAPSTGTRELVKKIADSMDAASPAPSSSLPPEAPPSETPIAKSPAPAPSPRGYVPVSLRRFFGREEESAAMQAFLTAPESENRRILTVTGTGGVGKTRLSQEVARRLQEHFSGRVWFASLAELPSAESLEDHIALTLQITPEPGTSLEEQIIEALDAAPSLLVLDNFERLVESGAEFVKRLASRTANLRLLITSQRRLEISGERELSLQPLPTSGDAGDFSDILEQTCVRLFVDRAQEARPDFQATAQNAPVIARLCQALEGLPLAIELAAAWSQTLTPSQMLERMAEKHKWLVNPRKGGNQRHRTLHAAISWSYELLAPPLQGVLRQMGVFTGGCTLEAAQSVIRLPENASEAMALETSLRALRQRSLVFIEESGEHLRFWMLEAVRAFALEQLGREAPEVERRYAETYLAYARNWSDSLNTVASTSALDSLQEDIGNVRQALEWARERAPQMFLKVMSRMWRYFYLRSDSTEGRNVIERALTLEAHPDVLVMARLHFAAGRLNAVAGDRRASMRYFAKSLALFQSIQLSEQQIYCLMELARGAQEAGDAAQARERYLAAFEHRERRNDRWNMARIARHLAIIAEVSGNLNERLSFLERSVALCKECGDPWGEADALEALAQACRESGDEERAQLLLAAHGDAQTNLSIESGLAGMFLEIAASSADIGDIGVAYQQALMSLNIARELSLSLGLPLILQVTGALALRTQDYSAAHRLLDECLTLSEETQDYPRIQFVEPLYEQARIEAMR